MELLRKIIGREKSKEDPARLTLQSAQQVVEDYEHLLQTSPTLPGRVSDVSELPHDKETIKAAITACVYVTRDPVRTEQLRYNYLNLSSWQEGVGPETLGIDFSQLDLSVEPGELNQLLQKISDGMEKWTPIMEAEQKQLRSELQSMGAYRSRPLI